VVGLPVIITVRDDGKVFYMVDSSEASSAIRDEYPNDFDTDNITEADVKADLPRVEADHEKRHALWMEARGESDGTG
jgi:hypothetical protein